MNTQHLDRPRGIYADASRLYICDSDNHRVMIWNALPAASDDPATVVLGQADFGVPGTGASGRVGLRFPMGVESDGTVIFVPDGGNHRLLLYDAIPAAGNHGPAADRLIGQPVYTGELPNEGGVKKWSLYLGNRANSSPSVVGTTLWVPDQRNNRAIRYDVTP